MSEIISKNRETILLTVILIVSAILRLTGFGDFSFSNDELSALLRVQYDNFRDLVDKGFYVDGHPGGIQVFLYYWVKLFGISEVAVRFPFVIAGIVSVLFVFLIGRKWFNPEVGLFAALFMGKLQFSVLYSQIARPYVTGMLFILMVVWFWSKFVFDYGNISRKQRITLVAGYIISTVLSMYNHYFSFLAAGMIGITGLFLINKTNRLVYVSSGIICLLLFIPHLGITINHLGIGGVGLWLGKPGYDWIFRHIFYIFNESILLILLVSAFFIYTLIKYGKLMGFGIYRTLLLIWFFIPFLIGFFYSRMVNPVLQHSVLIFSFPFLILFIFSYVPGKGERVTRIAFWILMIACIYSLTIEKRYYRSQHFGEFRGIAQKIAEWDAQYGPDEITHAINVNHPWYIQHYLDRYNSDATFVQYENKGGMDLLGLKHVVEQSATPYFLYAWTKPTWSETEDVVRCYYPYLVRKTGYGELSEVGLYGKHPAGSLVPEPQPVTVIRNGFESAGRWNANPSGMDSITVYSGKYSYRLDSSVEYGPAFDTVMANVYDGQIGSMKVTLWAFAPPGLDKTPLVISVNNTSGKNYIWASMNLEYFLDEFTWGKVIFNYEFTERYSPGDRLKIYVWNPNKMEFNIDEMEIQFYEHE
jgi:hypothetical protein